MIKRLLKKLFGKKRDQLEDQREAFIEMKKQLKQKSKNELIYFALNAVLTVAKYEKKFGKKFK